MNTDQQIERPQSQVFTCIDCNAPHDAENLFVLPMNELAKIKGEDDGPKNAFITPEDLPDFAHCAKCREPKEIYTLASALASSQRYHQRRITVVEAKELVSCFSCEELGKKTMVPRHAAKAPGWVGCNILKGKRLQFQDAEMQNPHRNPRLYVDSKEFLKPGKDGFALCPECCKVVVQVLQKLARKFGVPEYIIAKKTRSQPFVYMLEAVRRKEDRRFTSS